MKTPFNESNRREQPFWCLRKAIACTFPAATLRARFISRYVISTNSKDKLVVISSSLSTHSFGLFVFSKLSRQNYTMAVAKNQAVQAGRAEDGNKKINNLYDRRGPLGHSTPGE